MKLLTPPCDPDKVVRDDEIKKSNDRKIKKIEEKMVNVLIRAKSEMRIEKAELSQKLSQVRIE